MKFFWKLFCSMVLVTTLVSSVGGFVLIDAQFRHALEREVTSLYEENELLRFALSREVQISDAVGMSSREIPSLLGTDQTRAAFRVMYEDGTLAAGSGQLASDAASPRLGTDMEAGKRGWELCRGTGGRVLLHAASTEILLGEAFLLENCRDVSDLFDARAEQYHSFTLLMLGLVLVTAVLSFLIASVMLRPLRRLSSATRRMAAGRWNQQVPIRSRDELGQLSSDFNVMAARLSATVKELTEANRRQKDFLGSFAHEIKTPLTAIIGCADLIRSRSLPEEDLREYAGYIFQEGRRLEALSRKLMELIVLERRDFPLREVELSDFLKKIGEGFLPALEGRHIAFSVLCERQTLAVEPDLLEMVVINLLDNARKAIDDKGEILLEGIPETAGYCISVRDNGKGIPEEELERITEPFYMVEKSRARAQGGAGLGLALCRRIVELHGGRMEFYSTPGRGTRVMVHLSEGGSR